MAIEAVSLVSGMTALGHAVNIVKTLTGTVRELGKAEMVTNLIELQSALLDIQQRQIELLAENQTLKEANKGLQKSADLEEHMTFTGVVYEIRGDPKKKADGWYCPVCFDQKGDFIRVKPYDGERGRSYWCQVCKVNLE